MRPLAAVLAVGLALPATLGSATTGLTPVRRYVEDEASLQPGVLLVYDFAVESRMFREAAGSEISGPERIRGQRVRQGSPSAHFRPLRGSLLRV
jgi:hypothetical protein